MHSARTDNEGCAAALKDVPRCGDITVLQRRCRYEPAAAELVSVEDAQCVPFE